MSMDTRGTRYSRKPQGNPATPDRHVDASRPQDGGALLTTRVHTHDLIDQQGGGRDAAATNKKAPIDKKKKDVKKEGNFKYIFYFMKSVSVALVKKK